MRGFDVLTNPDAFDTGMTYTTNSEGKFSVDKHFQVTDKALDQFGNNEKS